MYAVIGYGNTLRRDDGAGLALAQQMSDFLKQNDCDVLYLTTHQLTPELIYDLNAPKLDGVLFVDTRVGVVDAAVTIEPVMREIHHPTVGHQMTPETFLILLEGILGVQVHAWMVSVPGWDFGFGEVFSKKTQQALDDFLQDLGKHLSFCLMKKSVDHVA